MHFFKRYKYALIVLFLAMIPAFFTVQTFADNPPEINHYFGDKKPLGTGSVKLLFFKLYDVAVWCAGPSWSWNQPFALQVTYARNFSKETLAKTSVAEIERIYKIDPQAAASDYKQLQQLFPSVKAGDTITAVYLPGQGIDFYYNSQKLGNLGNETLAKQFMGIWFSPNAKSPRLRRQILHCDHC